MISSRRRPLSVALASVAWLGTAGCTVPNFQGPQIQNPPRTFLLTPDSYQQRRMFPEREVTSHSAWISTAAGPYSGIYVNGHPGVIGLEDALTAWEAARAAPEHPDVSFTELQPLMIDGREAWGWEERMETAARGLEWVRYRAVVSYDSASFAIDFYAGDPLIKSAAPDTLRAVIASFAVGRTRLNLPLIAIIGGVILLVANLIHTRRKEREARLRSINLVTIKKKEEEDEQEAKEGASVGAAAAPSATSAPPDSGSHRPHPPSG
jgi:hypothetical protein